MSRSLALSSLCLTFAFSAVAQNQPAFSVSTIAGVPGLAGANNGPVQEATFNRPTWLDVVTTDSRFSRGALGDIFIVDRVNQSIRRISGGKVSTHPVSFQQGTVSLDFDGPFGGGIMIEPAGGGCGSGVYDRGMYVASSGTQQIALVSMDGPLGARDDVFPLIGTAGVAGSRDGNETSAQFRTPTGIARSWNYPNFNQVGQRSLYVADTGNHTIRRIGFVLSFEACPQHKIVQTLAGTAGEPGSQDGVGVAARFNSPRGLAAGPDGSVFVADSGNHTIRRIATDGTVTTIAGEPGVSGSNDGPARSAHLNTPSGIAVNARGEIFIADTVNHCIRMLTTNGMLVTIAGAPGISGFADGDGEDARFAGPVGLSLTPDGLIFVADTSNHVIRRIRPLIAPADRRRALHP